MMAMLSIVVLFPIAALLGRGLMIGPADLWDMVNSRRIWSALTLSFRAALIASLFNLVFGLLLAWVLVRYRFWGRRFIDAAVDLPFALPTAVAGIALTALYAPNGVFGQALAPLGIRVAYTEIGIWVALVFIGLPFVVRTVQPVIDELDREVEEVSATLGAHRAYTLRRVILPTLGLIQYLNPTLQFGFAVLVFGEVVTRWHLIAFPLIWVGLAIYSLDNLRAARRAPGG
jgi:sulfate transport system permease protein